MMKESITICPYCHKEVERLFQNPLKLTQDKMDTMCKECVNVTFEAITGGNDEIKS